VSARLIGRTGATAGTDFRLAGVATIGASSDNEIRIVAPGVSRRHARILVENDQYFVEDAGATNGTFLNGGRVQREALRHLDVITLVRSVDLIFIKREGDTAPVAADGITNARVQIADGPEAGTVVEIPKGELTLGRAPSCNVVLASGLISKVHARIQRTSNQVVLQDLQSINGTFVNGARVDSVVVLKNGDVISFAGVRSVSVSIEGTAGAARDAKVAEAPAVMAAEPAFNQEWKTRFVWAPDELAMIEAARAEAMQLAAMRAPGAAGAAEKKPAAAAAKPAAPAPAKAEGNIAAPPVAPKAEPGVPPAPAPVEKVAAPPVAPKADAAPIKPGAPVPIKPEPAAAPPPAPAAPKPAAVAAQPPGVAVSPKPPEAAKADLPAPKPAQPVAPKPPVAPPAAKADKPADADGAPTMMIMPPGAAQDSEATMATSRAPRIRGLRLVGPGIPISLGIGAFIVGRAVGSDVRLDDRQVSRSHARITIDESGASVEDLQTVNGTLVNGKEVKARQQLQPGDTVQFGASEFKVELTT